MIVTIACTTSSAASSAAPIQVTIFRRIIPQTVNFWRWSQTDVADRRAATKRARFWEEVREGQREAEARSRP